MVFATSGRAEMAKRSVVHFVHHPGCSLLLVWCRSIAEVFFWKPRYLASDVFHGSFFDETSIMTPAIFHSKIMDHGYIIIHWIGRGINTYSFWKLKLANIDHDPAFFQYVQSFERKRGPDLVVTSSLAKQVMIELDSEKEEDVARSWGVIFFLCGKRWGFWNPGGPGGWKNSSWFFLSLGDPNRELSPQLWRQNYQPSVEPLRSWSSSGMVVVWRVSKAPRTFFVGRVLGIINSVHLYRNKNSNAQLLHIANQ